MSGQSRRKNQPALVRAAPKPVRPFFRGAISLSKFLRGVEPPTLKQRAIIVDQAILMLEGFYAHLPFKRAMYAVDPLQRLRLLKHRLPLLNDKLAFHRELIDVFVSLHDRHTVYLLPPPFDQANAWLPFRVEAYFDGNDRRYLVAGVVKGVGHPTFRRGVEVLSWNGIPIRRAVDIAGSQADGGNPAAAHAIGLNRLTSRFLGAAPPPDENWVIVEYQTPRRRVREVRFDWMVSKTTPEISTSDSSHGVAIESSQVQKLKRLLFAPRSIAEGAKLAAERKVLGTRTTLPDYYSARVVRTAHGKFGYIRIFSFEAADVEAFVTEFRRLVTLPKFAQNGLIIDVRDNSGGRISAAEQLLQMLTSRRIQPEPVQLINTPYILRLCQLQASNPALGPTGLAPWIPSIKRSMETGAVYSAGFPYTSPEAANDIGQKYNGPVILITSALSYSATDFFAAGFQDHGIGKILGIDNTTGAGGASFRTYAELRSYFKKDPNNPLKALPKGVGMQVAWCRSLRVGLRAGIELEDFGVTPDDIHQMTSRDLLKRNVDLIEQAASLLASGSRHGRSRILKKSGVAP